MSSKRGLCYKNQSLSCHLRQVVIIWLSALGVVCGAAEGFLLLTLHARRFGPRGKEPQAVEYDGACEGHTFSATMSKVHVTVKNLVDAQAFIDAFVWICTAIRLNPNRELSVVNEPLISEAVRIRSERYEAAAYHFVTYELTPLVPCSSEDIGPETRCWTKLFRSSIIAHWPFKRKWGPGLQLSFDMMTHLAAVENVFHVDGGIILAGFFTALVPIHYDEAAKSILWHFEAVDDSGDLLKPSQLSSVAGDWFKTQDPNMLRNSICLLGWFEYANILLGTRELLEHSQNKLTWSATPPQYRSTRREGFEIGGQFGFSAGPINITPQVARSWRFHSNVQRFSAPSTYFCSLRATASDC